MRPGVEWLVLAIYKQRRQGRLAEWSPAVLATKYLLLATKTSFCCSPLPTVAAGRNGQLEKKWLVLALHEAMAPRGRAVPCRPGSHLELEACRLLPGLFVHPQPLSVAAGHKRPGGEEVAGACTA